MKPKKFDLAVSISLIPIFGTGLALTNQLGHLSFFGLPIDFIDLNAAAIFFSSVTMAPLAIALFFSVAINYEIIDSLQGPRRFLGWLFVTGVASIGLWYNSTGLNSRISWPIAIAVMILSTIFFYIEHWLKNSSRKPVHERLAGWSLASLLIALVIGAGAFAQGWETASKKDHFYFLADTNFALITKSGELFIFEEYNSKTNSFRKGNIRVMAVDSSIDLTKKSIKRNNFEAQE